MAKPTDADGGRQAEGAKQPRLRATFALLCRPSAFAQMVETEDERRQAKEVRVAIWKSLGFVLGALSAGMLIGRVGFALWGPLRGPWADTLQYAGLVFLLWPVLAKQGWKVQSWKGETLPERVDRWIYRALYVLGTTLLVVAIAWPRA